MPWCHYPCPKEIQEVKEWLRSANVVLIDTTRIEDIPVSIGVVMVCRHVQQGRSMRRYMA